MVGRNLRKNWPDKVHSFHFTSELNVKKNPFRLLFLYSALHDALLHNQMDVVRAVLKAASSNSDGADLINAQNNGKQTPLHLAVLKNQAEAVALLLHSGAEPDLADVDGNTPLHLAAGCAHLVDCLQLLLNPRKTHHIVQLNQRNYAGRHLYTSIFTESISGWPLRVSRISSLTSHS